MVRYADGAETTSALHGHWTDIWSFLGWERDWQCAQWTVECHTHGTSRCVAECKAMGLWIRVWAGHHLGRGDGTVGRMGLGLQNCQSSGMMIYMSKSLFISDPTYMNFQDHEILSKC